MNEWLAEVVFVLFLVGTFAAALLAHRHAADAGASEGSLGGRRLTRWFVGLSAGTTANSGFIVTAAVGLGYAYGVKWIMLPIAWLLGDLVFWRYFPARINLYGHTTSSTTLSELIGRGLHGRIVGVVTVISAATIVACLAGYTSAQWLAGEKFLSGAFGLPSHVALVAFALLIVAYSAIGGFRGSVYTDTVQAVIRILGTLIALLAVMMAAWSQPDAFASNISAAGEGFLNPLPPGGAVGLVGFIAGYGAAAIGFGLGQPQIVSRYLAGRSPEETGAAKWIYIGFVQFTWIAMTLFGVLLRGVMPDIADPETGLSVFFKTHLNPIATGIIAADIFATIASTSNGLLIAMSQAVVHDLLPRRLKDKSASGSIAWCTVVIGAVTLGISSVIQGSVVTLALTSVSFMGAALAAAVIIKVMGWSHDAKSLAATMLVGLASALTWKYIGYGALINEAAIGIAAGLATNRLVVGLHP